MSTSRCLHVPSRLAIASVLHCPVLFWIYESLYGASGFRGHAYIPSGPFLLEAAISATALVIVFPVLLRGDTVQRLLAGVLVPLPLWLFGIAVYWIVWIFRWVYA
jgi:hypothetical protein